MTEFAPRPDVRVPWRPNRDATAATIGPAEHDHHARLRGTDPAPHELRPRPARPEYGTFPPADVTLPYGHGWCAKCSRAKPRVRFYRARAFRQSCNSCVERRGTTDRQARHARNLAEQAAANDYWEAQSSAHS